MVDKLKTARLFVAFCFIGTAALCQPPKAELKFLNGKDRVEIPFKRYRGWIIIDAVVNDSRKLSLILDTGAPIAVLAKEDLADELNLTIAGQAMVSGVDGQPPKAVPLAAGVTFSIGDIRIESGLMAVGATGNVIGEIDGILGKYLFDDAIVTINWDENNVVVAKPGSQQVPTTDDVLPITLAETGHVYTTIEIEKNNEKTSIKAVIDTGNRSGFSAGFDAGKLGGPNSHDLSDIVIAWGANGPVYGSISKTSVTLGSIQLQDVITSYPKNENKNDRLDLLGIQGNIGISILDRFTLTFDYPGGKLYLKKNAAFNKKFTYNRSGIILNPKLEKDFAIVADVIPGSPASEQGIMKDDRVLQVNEIDMSTLDGNLLDELVSGQGKDNIKLVIERDGKKIQINLTPRDLV